MRPPSVFPAVRWTSEQLSRGQLALRARFLHLRMSFFGKPVPTFPGHALAGRALLSGDSGVGAAPLRSGVAGAGVAPPVGPEVALGPDERPRMRDHIDDPLIERLGRDRLGEEFGDAGIARVGDAVLLGVT